MRRYVLGVLWEIVGVYMEDGGFGWEDGCGGVVCSSFPAFFR